MSDNQRFLTALILSFIFVYFYTGWLAKKYSANNSEPSPATAERAEPQSPLTNQEISWDIDLTSSLGFFENEHLKGKLVASGGMLTDLDIKKIKAAVDDPRPYRIISSAQGHYLFGVIDNGQIDTSPYEFIENDNGSVTLQTSDGNIVKRFSYKDTPYKVEFSFNANRPVNLIIKGFNGEKDSRYNLKNVVTLDSNNKIKRHPIAPNQRFSDVKGFGFDSLHFSIFAVSKNKSIAVKTEVSNGIPILIVDPRSENVVLDVFIGPKEVKILESLGDPYIKLLDLGFFAILADPILRMLLMIAEYVKNFGLAIVILTVLIRLALYPVSAYGYKAMERLKEIQPEIDKLRKQYENDPQSLNRELILLYQKKKVNPMSGCLPIIIQIPIFFGLYSALLHAVELRLQPYFGWIKDLSSPDYLYLGPVPIPVLTLLFGASLIYQQKLNPPQLTDPAQEAVFKWLPYIFVALFIVFPMPSGLILYWLVNNISSIAQQILVKKSGLKTRFVNNLAINLFIVAIAYILSFL